ncbi:MAG: ATP-binding protein [Planctomycetaceae bacterium]|jgi:SpoVK/Ycf46/Vps4 family AAA+-type ATPase|nr:ATP-binding protein [Planctomycetaceae bacterium]
MATATQIKSLIKSHYESDNDTFLTAALQVAAHEARQGHSALAQDIRSLIERSRREAKPLTNPFASDEDGLFLAVEPKYCLSELIVPKELHDRLERILVEYRQKDKLERHGLRHRRRILLAGPSGTGKTMTADVIAHDLRLPLYVVLMERIVTKYMGETSAKLRMVFDKIRDKRGVYLFDEFDAIGAERSLGNDVGEMRRVLNSFLQFVEQDPSDSILVAATNNLSLLDQALFRRFDDVLYYRLPDKQEVKHLIENSLGRFRCNLDVSDLSSAMEGLSHAEIVLACMDAKKEAILTDSKEVDCTLLEKTLRDRHTIFRPNSQKEQTEFA